MGSGIKIAVLGFSSPNDERFRTIFRFTRYRHRCYTYCPDAIDCDADILIINSDAGCIEEETNEILAERPNIVVVAVRLKSRFDLSRHQIKKAVLGGQLLSVLDRIGIEKRNSKCRRIKNQHFVRRSNGRKFDKKNFFQVVETAANKSFVPKRTLPLDVLVVDDSPSMQKMLELEFAQTFKEMRVRAVETGEQALACIAERAYDFIFLDVMMPGIDGYETCTRIRKNPTMKQTPIIMLSAKTSPLDEVKGIMAGCTTYLTKPIEHEEFQKVVGRILHWLDEYRRSKTHMMPS